MRISPSGLLALSTIASLTTFAAAIDEEEEIVKRLNLSETPPIEIRLSQPIEGEDFDFVFAFDLPFTDVRFINIQSESTSPPEVITEENVWQWPLILSASVDLRRPEAQKALAGLSDLTEYTISYSGGPEAAMRIICSLDTIINKGMPNEDVSSYSLESPDTEYPILGEFRSISCQAWFLQGYRPDDSVEDDDDNDEIE